MSEHDGAAAQIRITGGNPSPEQVAAVTAVLSAALEQLAGEDRPVNTGLDSWQRSQPASPADTGRVETVPSALNQRNPLRSRRFATFSVAHSSGA